MTDAPHQQAMPDGSAFYDASGMNTVFYDLLYGRLMTANGDLEWYDSLAEATGDTILDAGCGDGRVFSALAKPGRQIFAFDSSNAMLDKARERAHEARAITRVNVTRQKLEEFSYDEKFDLILLPYYCFSNLLDTESRKACLARIADHLKPEGRAVLHLPAPTLLSRDVSEQELAGMSQTYTLTLAEDKAIRLKHEVVSMTYDPARKLRIIGIRVTLQNTAGQDLKTEEDFIYYSCLSEDELRREAGACGLAITAVHGNFGKGPETELIAVLALDAP